MTAGFVLAIVVHFVNIANVPAPIVRDAQAQVTEMFRDVGVEVEWAPAERAAIGQPEAIRLTLLPYEIGSLRSDRRTVLGAAMRTTLGTGVAWVFSRRVESEAERYLAPVERILACAMAHEIGHLLQQMPVHAESGLMRATWNSGDYRRAAVGRLRFTAADAEQFGPIVAVHGAEALAR